MPEAAPAECERRLDDAFARKLQPPSRGYKIHYDGDLAGFGVRITANGARSFVLNYRRRSDGFERRSTIGAYPAWSVSGARDEAKRLPRVVDGGGDPVGEQQEQRGAPDTWRRFEAPHLTAGLKGPSFI